MATIDDLLKQFTPRIKKAFIAAMRDISDNAIIAEMVEAIRMGDPIAAYRALGMTVAAMRPFTAMIEKAFEEGGITTAASFPKRLNTSSGKVVFRFDVRNSRAEKMLREHSGTLIREISDQTLTAVRNVVFEGVKEGRNPRNIALDITGRIDPATGRRSGGIIGLTSQQERWAANMQKDLKQLDERYFTRERRDKRFDATVRKSFESGKPLSAETISKLTSRYKNNLLNYRGETIARDQANAALNMAEHEAINQAIDLGATSRKNVERIWDSVGNDGRTRDTHLAMDGQKVQFDQPFVSPSGARLMYPGDRSLGAPAEETVQCRCRTRLKVDWIN